MTAHSAGGLRRWVIDYQGPPPPNMNGGVSRWTTIKKRRLWRANAAILGNLAGLPKRQIARYQADAVFFRRNLKVADEDGDHSRLKSVIDGLVSEKYLPGDNRRFVVWGPTREEHGPAGFRLVIRELPADQETIERAQQAYSKGDGDDPLERVRQTARRGRSREAML